MLFRRLREARLRPNPDKCHYYRNSLKCLGHVVDAQGLRTDSEKSSAITNWTAPTTVRKVRQFLEMASWYRRFVPNFSTIAAPLTQLTKKFQKKGTVELGTARGSSLRNPKDCPNHRTDASLSGFSGPVCITS